jgi:hypothetical protein
MVKVIVCNDKYIAGESTHRVNENLYDAVILGSKRIGHGFNLGLHPVFKLLIFLKWNNRNCKRWL